MDFATIGKLSTYVKQKNLTFAAKHKLQTGQVLTNANGNLVSANTSTFDKLCDVSKIAADKSKQIKLRRIKNKLLSGKKLSEDEMSFLRVNDPKTYKKAKNADEAREELKAELRKAKSKEEAQEAIARAMVKASSEAVAELGALGQSGGICGGNAAMQTSGDAMNLFGGNASTATGEVNISSTEAQTNSDTAQTTGNVNAATGNTHDANNTAADKAHGSQQDDAANTPEDILEKYIMTIRALEDEWARFTNSKEYKDLPDHVVEEKAVVDERARKKIVAPNRKLLEAISLYRKAMLRAYD